MIYSGEEDFDVNLVLLTKLIKIFNSDKGIYFTPERELLHNLDELPYPAYDLFPLEDVYFKNSQVPYSEEAMMATRRLDINASIGCSLICKFCYHLGIAGDMRYEKDKNGKKAQQSLDCSAKPKTLVSVVL